VSAPWLQELFLDPVHESRRVGVRLGDVVVMPFLSPEPGAAPAEGRTSAQLAEVLGVMDEALAKGGGSRAAVARVTVFLRDVGDRPVLNEAWAACFPEPLDRPPHKYVPAPLPDGVNVALGVLALLGGERVVLEVDGVVHSDPMSLGARIGNVVTSSRLFASEADVSAQFDALMGHAAALLSGGGGTLEDLTQLTFFVGSPEIADEVEGRLIAVRQAPTSSPVVHVREASLGGNGYPRLEVLALVAEQD
jgi:2-iminobutanoate/2-iminopropanoate deaminase